MKWLPMTVVAVAAVAAMGGILFARDARAAGASSAPMAGLVEKLAAKFNLNKDEVEAVFEADRTERQQERRAEMTTQLQERLTQAVAANTITAEQQAAILARHADLQQALTAADGQATVEAAEAAREDARASFQQWLKDNGIDESVVRPVGDREGRHGRGGSGQASRGHSI